MGRFQILDRIATGGMGAVYKALDLKRGREVALKILAPDQAASNPILLERFKLEARYGRRLNHENVVSFYHYGTANGVHYLALEYVDGIDLLTYVGAKGPLQVNEARDFLVQATKAIDHLHRHGITHRDIKPSNFLVTKKKGKPQLKLIDLGLARRTLESQSRMTHDGSSLGTVDYMSPEQAHNAGAADIRSDIYSLGCTWYHLLAGKAPFAEGTILERVYKHVQDELPDIRQFNPAIPEGVVQILGKMLAKHPSDRYQTPAELLVDLEKLSKQERMEATKKNALPVPAGPNLDAMAQAAPEPAQTEEETAVGQTNGPRSRRLRDSNWDERWSKKKRKRRPGSELKWWVGGSAAALLVIGLLATWLALQAPGPAARPIAPPTQPPVTPANKVEGSHSSQAPAERWPDHLGLVSGPGGPLTAAGSAFIKIRHT
jgi:serine/threonine protein kinase